MLLEKTLVILHRKELALDININNKTPKLFTISINILALWQICHQMFFLCKQDDCLTNEWYCLWIL